MDAIVFFLDALGSYVKGLSEHDHPLKQYTNTAQAHIELLFGIPAQEAGVKKWQDIPDDCHDQWDALWEKSQAYFGVAGIEGTVPTPYKMRGWFVRVLGELAATYPQELHSELVERGFVEERQGDFRDHERVRKVRTRNFELRKTAFPWLLKKRPVNIAILGFLVVDRICHFSESKAQKKIPKVIGTAKNIEEVFDPEYVFYFSDHDFSHRGGAWLSTNYEGDFNSLVDVHDALVEIGRKPMEEVKSRLRALGYDV